MIAVDTYLLVYAQRAGTAQHRAARRALERASAASPRVGNSAALYREVLVSGDASSKQGRTIARPRSAGFFQALVEEGGASIWSAGAGFWERLTQQAGGLRVTGARVFGLQIDLSGLENGALQLWSHDRGFAGLPGLLVRDPL